jgi:hypothetical protein
MNAMTRENAPKSQKNSSKISALRLSKQTVKDLRVKTSVKAGDLSWGVCDIRH